MAVDLLSELREGLAVEGSRRSEYTRRAYEMLPVLERPRILDVGCGRGGSTRELARLGRGLVVGMDLDRPSLGHLARRCREVGLAKCVQAVRGSMAAMCFRDGSFDIVWAEGAIFVIGFVRGLEAWRRLVRDGGFLVVHEAVWLRPDPPVEILNYWQARAPVIRTVDAFKEEIVACKYDLVGWFALPKDAWWIEYFGPLAARIQELRVKYAGDGAAGAMLDGQQREVEMFRRSQDWYGSAFFVMRR